MQRILDKKLSESFRNPSVIARLSGGVIHLEQDKSKPLETFEAMYTKRKPTSPSIISKALTGEGFALANLGISVVLEIELAGKGKFAAFTRRGNERKCLALISGYWDVSLDPTPRDCAERELLEELLVFDLARQSFLVPEGFIFPFPKCSNLPSSDWSLSPFNDSIEWVQSARFQSAGLDSCYVYIDATTSSAQAVYSYRATFNHWEELSLFHAEDHSDQKGNLVTTADDESVVLFEIQQDHLLSPAYQMKNGELKLATLPEDVYFHPSMVGADRSGIVSTDEVSFNKIIS